MNQLGHSHGVGFAGMPAKRATVRRPCVIDSVRGHRGGLPDWDGRETAGDAALVFAWVGVINKW